MQPSTRGRVTSATSACRAAGTPAHESALPTQRAAPLDARAPRGELHALLPYFAARTTLSLSHFPSR
jgi:hypothetical protein